MLRSLLLLAAPLLLGTALAGCSSSAPAVPSATTSATTPAVSAPASTAPGGGDGSGAITFTGKVSGKMTISACPDGGPAQLTVAIDGEDTTYAGVIDKDDFTFVAPSSTGYTLAKGASRPQVSGRTYTVESTKLVGITNDDTVTADGSVTCP
ncbi:MAG TPA: hypothetical protein VGC37_07615 [Friedmanniella sp.]